MTDLLIMTCSKAKRKLQNSPAIDVYNGTRFKMIRKRRPDDLRILIISAKYGLIEPDTEISWYDQIMTRERALELMDSVSSGITRVLRSRQFESIYLDLSGPYLLTLDLSTAGLIIFSVGESGIFHYAQGTRGARLHQLSEWLIQREVNR